MALCTRCNSVDGIYRWGTVTNGVPAFSGTCFRCKGSGKEPSSRPTVARAGQFTLAQYLDNQLKTGGLAHAMSIAANFAGNDAQPRTALQAAAWMDAHQDTTEQVVAPVAKRKPVSRKQAA